MTLKKTLQAVLLCFTLILQAICVGGCDWLTEVVYKTSSSIAVESSETEQSSDNYIESEESSSEGESVDNESSSESESTDNESSSEKESSEESSEAKPCLHQEIGGILIAVQPTKTTYAEGDVFDTSGMVVKTYCKGCAEELAEVDGYTVEYPSGKTAFRISDTYVTIVYGQYRASVGISVGSYTPSVPI